MRLLKCINYHKFMAQCQRRAFNEQRNDNDLLGDSLVIVMDFKAVYEFGKYLRSWS